jgi:hypothetical protein
MIAGDRHLRDAASLFGGSSGVAALTQADSRHLPETPYEQACGGTSPPRSVALFRKPRFGCDDGAGTNSTSAILWKSRIHRFERVMDSACAAWAGRFGIPTQMENRHMLGVGSAMPLIALNSPTP